MFITAVCVIFIFIFIFGHVWIHTRDKHKVKSNFIFNIFVVEILTKFYKTLYGKFLM